MPSSRWIDFCDGRSMIENINSYAIPAKYFQYLDESCFLFSRLKDAGEGSFKEDRLAHKKRVFVTMQAGCMAYLAKVLL